VTTSYRWSVPPESDLQWRFWDGRAVVFDTPSANTHILDAFSAELLLLLRHPASAEDLAAGLSATLQVDKSEILSRVESVLPVLAEAGLIEPAEP
jgi:PqqD family protein of HPr-rel-A system